MSGKRKNPEDTALPGVSPKDPTKRQRTSADASLDRTITQDRRYQKIANNPDDAVFLSWLVSVSREAGVDGLDPKYVTYNDVDDLLEKDNSLRKTLATCHLSAEYADIRSHREFTLLQSSYKIQLLFFYSELTTR
jgi:hypothetical protein